MSHAIKRMRAHRLAFYYRRLGSSENTNPINLPKENQQLKYEIIMKMAYFQRFAYDDERNSFYPKYGYWPQIIHGKALKKMIYAQ